MSSDDLSTLIRAVQDQRPDLSQSEIARRVGVSPAAVNTWVNRKRGIGRGPNRETLVKLATVLGLPEREVFAAAGRRLPGPTTPDMEQRVLELFRGLTAEQQKVTEIQIRALYDHNQATEQA
ncbi:MULTISPECIES: helix-turn-helix transcriptional regulator [unclassified Streptomyces]|uniref:helix-turn-helix domain-containing protein n=1 Tax=unclassified Streptomyces TaxID=2593676 RepID=UPI00224FBB80|nr:MULTISPECIES: helix-turn-helix transcriptional regulator [unclassified Streptomyces]MCX4863485.1 helix-turn-helix transcriptional regulator [Streptomyces sp. NBC_00906]MCX4894723.1 helix-turn-helix transcriptional regulator [Streptomyces sp. NBC_00892]